MSHKQPQQCIRNSNIPVSEVYWYMVAKADKKFCNIRDVPYYQRTRYHTYFYKVFKVYTKLWKFQKENRQTLVEAGIKRWEIGEIASRMGQLHFELYMRTSEASYLSEAYIFYEAILTREYFKDELHQDVSIASKQLMFLARFLAVCLVLNRRQMVYQLVDHLKMSVDEYKRTFKEINFKDWKLLIQEIDKFLKADAAFMNLRPLRYSVVLDTHPDCLPLVMVATRKLRLHDSILCSYHPNEVKVSDFTLDTLRMLQSLEWEPSGSFYQSNTAPSIGTGPGSSHNEASGSSPANLYIADPTLPSNPRKAILLHPQVTHFMAVLGTACEELPSDGILLIYLSTSENGSHVMSSPTRTGSSMGYTESIVRGFQLHSFNSDSNSTCHSTTATDSVDHSVYTADCIHIGPHEPGGMNCIYPSDILPFTRRPLFLIVDSETSKAFKGVSGAERGEAAAILLSPVAPLPLPSVDSSSQLSSSLFTGFLTAPLQTFFLMVGLTDSDVKMDQYNTGEKLVKSLFNQLGSLLATADDLDPVWAQILNDPFLRRLLLRFVFCRAVLSTYSSSMDKMEFLPECAPCLPEVVSPMSWACRTGVLQVAKLFGVSNRFRHN